MVDDATNIPASPPVILGRYRVEDVIGEGAFGVVVRARDTVLKKLVAIKTLKRSGDSARAYYFDALEDRFTREAEAGARVGDHPNVVNVYDFVLDASEVRYLIMEYAARGTLEQLLEKQSPLPLQDALRLTADVARGLHTAHEAGIIHRDVKPANIFLASDGRAQVGDFGVAQVDRLSRRTHLSSATHPGSPLYMSPEQSRSTGYVRAESDQYSVGLILFEMLTGKPLKPLREREVNRLLTEQPQSVAMLIRRMGAELPDDRYESLDEVREKIEAILAAERLASRVTKVPQGTQQGSNLEGDPPLHGDNAEGSALRVGMMVVTETGWMGTIEEVLPWTPHSKGAARIAWSGDGTTLVSSDMIAIENGTAYILSGADFSGAPGSTAEGASTPRVIIGNDATDAPDLLLGRYRIEQTIAEDPYYTVIEAFDTRLGRAVAIKTPKRSPGDGQEHPGFPDDWLQHAESWLQREAEVGARLPTHPHLMIIHDLVRGPDGTLHLVHEFASGGDLAVRIKEQGTLALADALHAIRDAATGLDVAHARGIVHRNIKPANLHFAGDGGVKVGGFNLAQIGTESNREHTTVGHPGTPLYMSPEQSQSTGYLKPASDQYSLGLVLFEALTGEAYKRLGRPRAEEHLAAMPPPVASVIRRMLDADPDNRYLGMGALLGALAASSLGAMPMRHVESILSQPKLPRVLWVDDRPENNDAERSELEGLGIQFTLSTSTEDALQKAGTTTFDVIISDMGRPSDPRAGYTLLERLHAIGIYTPFVVYAGSNLPEQRAEAMRRGGFGSTNSPRELIKLVLDAIQKGWVTPSL